MSKSITFRHRLEYGLFRLLKAAVGLLSWEGALALGRGLGRIWFHLDARHRRITADNLRMTDLGLSAAEIKQVSRACFAHYGALAVSSLALLSMSKEDLLARVSVEGLEHWDAARREGRGFIGLSGHYGNMDGMGLVLSAMDRPLSVIGRELDNPLLEPYLLKMRLRFGNQVIYKNGAVRDSLKVLKRNGCVGYFLDQDALTNGVFVRFLGVWASTFPSAALLAVKYDVPVVPIFCWHEAGRLVIRVDRPFRAPHSGDQDRDVWVTTQLMTRCIEAQVRRDPRWWFWMHRRFKTRPGEGHPLPAPLPPAEWVAAAGAVEI